MINGEIKNNCVSTDKYHECPKHYVYKNKFKKKDKNKNKSRINYLIKISNDFVYLTMSSGLT